ncbi:YheC/YheD family protein [Ureibacillus aquaedulcis]|uniref:YheC/YheD family protein n=1 Tax=Ureibacillus aquaedulcis TaxID=3058421 RepID=A0ABT8GUT9_9BACL|nr:YheC/YheD family protein [Ureibacillus sp. BA0131]MDN4494969.1 YheC/YheD family protein [Ureibacillus sp. BA0131]
MIYYFKELSENRKNLLFLPLSIWENMNPKPQWLTLQAGEWMARVEVELREDLPENTVGVSTIAEFPFNLPEQIPFEMKIQEGKLRIGPIMGILAFHETHEMTAEALEKYTRYLAGYSSINGLIYICSAKGINHSLKTIEGYCFNLEEKTSKPVWMFGKFPFPDVLYCHLEQSEDEYNQTLSVMRGKILNANLSSKWLLSKLFQSSIHLRGHWPYTELLNNDHKLDDMLNKFGSVYLKPLVAEKGKLLFKVDKKEGSYRIHDYFGDEKSLNSTMEVNDYLKGALHDTYLVQQAVPVVKYEERCFNFKVHMQKTSRSHWKCAYITAHFGETGGISANFNRTGIVLNGRDALRQVFQMDEREVFKKEQEIIELCCTACKTLEHSKGSYAELSIDIILDENLSVWLMDINHHPDHQSLFYSDRQLYLNVLATPLEYAKLSAW